jgi:lipoprotein-anchoring transpeptidase ErfK/SrfK
VKATHSPRVSRLAVLCTAVALSGAFLVPSLPVVAAAEPGVSDTGVPSTTASAPATPPPVLAPQKRPAKVRLTKIVVVLREQKVYAYTTVRGQSRLVAVMNASTGLANSTPVGTFRVFAKRQRTFYRARPSEKMEWMTRFTKGAGGDNIGFHGIPYTVDKKGRRRPHFTPLGVRPSSHGCVRLADADARWLYANVSVSSTRRGTTGTTVVVVRSRTF